MRKCAQPSPFGVTMGNGGLSCKIMATPSGTFNNVGNVVAARMVPALGPRETPRGYGRRGPCCMTVQTRRSVRTHPRGARLPRHFETFAGVRDLVAVDPQYGEVAVHIVADIDGAAVRRESDSFRQCADLDVVEPRYFFAVDRKHRDH